MMRSALVLLCTTLPLMAQEQPLPIAALSGDWNADGNPDAVLLYGRAEGDADLVVMLGHDWQGLQPGLHLPGVVFFGGMAGQVPRLESRSPTSFAILSEQTGIGREPWQMALTVAFRQGEFRVAGFDYLFYDRLDPTHNGNCSVNLLTGRYSLTFGPGDEAPEVTREGDAGIRAFALADLGVDFFPDACRAIFE